MSEFSLKLRQVIYISASISVLLLLSTLVGLHAASDASAISAPREYVGYVVGRDFLNFWNYGRAAWSSDAGRFYNIVAYNDLLTEQLGFDYPAQQWSYPPTLLLLAAPFGRLPYLWSLLLFEAAGLVALLLAIRSLWPSGQRPAVTLLVLASPAAFMCLLSGQLSFFIAAITIYALKRAQAQPIVCGMLIGLLSVKPQVAMLFPVALMATRNWRCLASAGLASLALAAATTALFSLGIWREYLNVGVPMQNVVLEQPTRIVAALMPTIFIDLRALGVTYGPALLIQACVALLTIAVIYRAFASRSPEAEPLFLIGVVLVTPYLMCYDLVVAAFALASRSETREKSYGAVAAAFYLLPLLHFIAMGMGIPGTASIPVVLGGMLLLGKHAAEVGTMPALATAARHSTEPA